MWPDISIIPAALMRGQFTAREVLSSSHYAESSREKRLPMITDAIIKTIFWTTTAAVAQRAEKRQHVADESKELGE